MRGMRNKMIVGAFLLVFVLALSACTGRASSGGGSEGSSSGEDLARSKCSQCHTYERVENAEKSRAVWEQTVDRMIQQGLTVTDEERQTIVDYLAERDQ